MKQIRTMNVGDQKVALQLWDTAGQERYRSITRQYFRKADGVVIVYDVTNEQSFLAVRNWIQCIQVQFCFNCSFVFATKSRKTPSRAFIIF